MKLFEMLSKLSDKQVVFSSTQENSPIFVSMLKKLEKTGISKQQLIDFCKTDMEDLEKSYELAPKLMKTMYENRWETSLFTLLWKHSDPEQLAKKIGAPIFNTVIMGRLRNQMAGIPKGTFFPLRSVVEPTAQKTPLFEYAEDDPEEYSGIETAAAYLDGRYVFNKGFMQSLINYAHLKELKPTSNYFKCNNGPIPDEYGYAEFVMAHEFLHYTNSDFHVQHKVPNPNPKIINMATDLRSNYYLVKMGFSQLPIGLFSDEFNFNKYNDINKLYNEVRLELQKAQKDNKDQGGEGDSILEETLDKYSNDDHEPGNKAAQSAAEQKKANKASTEDFNNHAKEQADALEDTKETASSSENAKNKSNPQKDKRSNSPGRGVGSNQAVSKEDIKPVFKWRKLIDDMISSVNHEIVNTWNKLNKRSVSSVVAMSTTGSGAIKPGIMNADMPEVNIIISIDCSGSMGDEIKVAYNESIALMRSYFPQSDFYVMLWSGNSNLYRCNIGANRATLISSLADTNGGPPIKLDTLFSTYEAGGTEFDTCAHKLNEFLNQNYNVILITDNDISYDSNLTALISLAKNHGDSICIILRNQTCFNEVTKALSGYRLQNISCFG